MDVVNAKCLFKTLLIQKNKILFELASCTDVDITGNATDCTQVELYTDKDRDKYFL